MYTLYLNIKIKLLKSKTLNNIYKNMRKNNIILKIKI